jgi:hypothetical protein
MAETRLRRDTAAEWTRVNPVLADGEPGYEKDTRKLKIGDGVSTWTTLSYFGPGVSEAGEVSDEELLAHIDSETPHPIYDDGPSLVLLWENAKV